jgi:arabinofuranan 3-O-arabinosyltransferase
VAPDGSVTFEPLRAKAVTVRLRADGGLAQSLDPYTLVQSGMGIGASEIRVPGVTPEVRVSSTRLSAPVRFPCGEGPTLALDGRRVATRVDTTVGALLRAEGLDVVVCGSAEVQVPQGQVRLRALAPDVWDVTDVSLTRPLDAQGGPAGQDGSATAEVQQWGPTERSVGLSARTVATVLRIAENQNAGWRATLGGVVLRPLSIDGWQQGWVVPAGAAGVVRLSFTPDGPVRVGMLASACLTVVLLVLALLPEKLRLRKVRRAGPGARASVIVVGVVGLALVGGWVAVGMVVLGLVLRDRLPARWRARLAPSTTTDWTPVVASAAYGLAGLVLVSGPYLHSPYRAGEPLTQVLCLVALVALIVSAAPLVLRRAPRR